MLGVFLLIFIDTKTGYLSFFFFFYFYLCTLFPYAYGGFLFYP